MALSMTTQRRLLLRGVLKQAAISRPMTATPTPTQGACVGDCDNSGDVKVNELVTGVNIALDRAERLIAAMQRLQFGFELLVGGDQLAPMLELGGFEDSDRQHLLPWYLV
jgi:hypothetical protein